MWDTDGQCGTENIWARDVCSFTCDHHVLFLSTRRRRRRVTLLWRTPGSTDLSLPAMTCNCDQWNPASSTHRHFCTNTCKAANDSNAASPSFCNAQDTGRSTASVFSSSRRDVTVIQVERQNGTREREPIQHGFLQNSRWERVGIWAQDLR